jgi:hypothetical protein
MGVNQKLIDKILDQEFKQINMIYVPDTPLLTWFRIGSTCNGVAAYLVCQQSNYNNCLHEEWFWFISKGSPFSGDYNPYFYCFNDVFDFLVSTEQTECLIEIIFDMNLFS